MNADLSPLESEFATTDEANAYDVWFRAKVEKSLQLADQPDAVRIPHDEVMSKARARIEAKLKEKSVLALMQIDCHPICLITQIPAAPYFHPVEPESTAIHKFE